MNDNLTAVKILLFLAAVLSALAAVYTGFMQQVCGFASSVVCFISFLLIMFYKSEKESVYDKSKDKIKKDRYYDYKESEFVKKEAPKTEKPEVSQYKVMQLNDSIPVKKEIVPSKEELTREKITVLNKFASVASHDLKNPLSSMKNIAYYFSNSVKIEGEVPNKMLKMLASEVDRMNNMIVELLDSTRVKQLSKISCDLNVPINETVEKHKKDKFVFDVNLQQLQINADPERIKQVFSSIIQNAKDAMPDGGSITIKTHRSANEAIIEISDTGAGMDENALEKCFDPMFSTKTTRALGMSLTVSKQIVDMHGGSIKAESSAGKGSKFTVTLPLAV